MDKIFNKPHTWCYSFGERDGAMNYCQSNKPPNWFHRLMMRLILGIHTRVIK